MLLKQFLQLNSHRLKSSSGFAHDYDLGQEIGKGSFSVCKLCTHKASKTEYAVKVSNFS